MPSAAPRHARYDEPRVTGGVEGNTRLTASVAAILLVTLFLEGLTILQVGAHLSWHVFLGALLIPIVLVKVASTFWRFAKYYGGSPSYRRKGPPATLLRLLGPFVVVLSVILLGTGVGLIVGTPLSLRGQLLQLHRISFILWFGAMTIHVLGHLGETLRVAPRDWVRRTRREVAGATIRQWVEVASLALGVIVALWLTPYAHSFFSARGPGG